MKLAVVARLESLHTLLRGIRASKSILIGFIDTTSPRFSIKVLLATLMVLNIGLGVVLWYQFRGKNAVRDELAHRKLDVQRFEGEVPSIPNRLPLRADAGALLIRVQRLAAENNIALMSLSPSKDTPIKPTAGLRKESWDMQLSGDYVAIKNLLGTLLEQSPEIWLARLHMKATSTSVDAQITLQAWTLDVPTGQPSGEATR